MGQTFPPWQDGHPKLKLSTAKPLTYCGTRVFLPASGRRLAGCGTVPCVDIRCWLWYTSCTSRITSDKRLRSSSSCLLPPAPKPPFPAVPRSCLLALRLACLCPPFCPSTIRRAPSLIIDFLISSFAPSLAPSVPIQFIHPFSSVPSGCVQIDPGLSSLASSICPSGASSTPNHLV